MKNCPKNISPQVSIFDVRTGTKYVAVNKLKCEHGKRDEVEKVVYMWISLMSSHFVLVFHLSFQDEDMQYNIKIINL